MRVLNVGKRSRYRKMGCDDFLTNESARKDDVVVILRVEGIRRPKCYVLQSLTTWLVTQVASGRTPTLPDSRHEVDEEVYRKLVDACFRKHPDVFPDVYDRLVGRRPVQQDARRAQDEDPSFSLEELMEEAFNFDDGDEDEAIDRMLEDMSEEDILAVMDDLGV